MPSFASPSNLRGRTAIVLGDPSALITAVAQALAQAGARVVIAGNATAEDTQGGHSAVTFRPHDIFDANAWDRLFAAVTDVDLVVAGPAPTTHGSLAELTEAQFKVAEANRIIGPWMILKHVIPTLAQRPRAAIAMMASAVGSAPAADRLADCATFGAFTSMFKSAAIECGQTAPNVRINAVIADERGVAPAEIAAAVVQVVAPESDFMTGAELVLASS